MPDPTLAAVRRHAQLRWVGVPLFVSGVLLAFLAFQNAMALQVWGLFGLAVGGAVSGLAAFGANHDTAMALAMRLPRGALAPALQVEVTEEEARLRRNSTPLRPNARAALLVPLVSMGIQMVVFFKLLLA